MPKYQILLQYRIKLLSVFFYFRILVFLNNSKEQGAVMHLKGETMQRIMQKWIRINWYSQILLGSQFESFRIVFS